MVNTLRRSPFGEWNVVYYDSTKTNQATILERLQKNKCPKAKLIESKPVSAHGVSITPMNPIVAAGDTIQLRLEATDSDATIEVVVPPKGWKLLTASPLSKGKTLHPVQSPPNAKNGKHNIQVKVKKAGAEVKTVELSVELVQQIR